MTSSTTDLVVDIVRTLEKQGVPRDSYQVASEFDPEALARLVDSGGSTVEVRLEVQGVSLVVTNLGARVTDEEPSTHPECGVPVTAVVQLVPDCHNAYPCGCRVRGDLLE
ncbi:HalOD1 output domain-containing protein [Halostagnicola bangensis]